MSSLGSLISDIGYAAGDRGKTKTTVNVKNKQLQKEIDSGLSNFGEVQEKGQNALRDYITKYLAGEGAAGTRTNQEIGNLDRYFNGAAGGELDYLRSQRKAAIQDAADRASGYALGNINRSRAFSDGGPSSYDRRLALRNTGDIMTQAAVDDAAQARNDWNFLEQAKAGYTGQRNSLANSLAAYGLVPEQMRRQMYGQDLGYLGQIGELDRGNKFYGLQYQPSGTEQAGAITDGVVKLAMDIYSGGATAGMGGGSGENLSSKSRPQYPQSVNGYTGGGQGWQTFASDWNPDMWNQVSNTSQGYQNYNAQQQQAPMTYQPTAWGGWNDERVSTIAATDYNPYAW